MTNEQIIAKFEEKEGCELHTIQGWSSVLGTKCLARKGSHGIECRLWNKKKNKNDEEFDDENAEISSNFYLHKSFLFKREDVVTQD